MLNKRFHLFVPFLVAANLLTYGHSNAIAAVQEAEATAEVSQVGAEVLTALGRTFEFEGTLEKADLQILDGLLPEAQGEGAGSVPLRLAIAAAEAQEAGESTLLSQYISRIVDGLVASPGEFPWQVALVAAGYPAHAGQFCGGSIIAADWILTAAHCVDQTAPSQLYVFAGNRDLAATSAQRRNVSEVYSHTWNAFTQKNDIALLRLKGSLDLVEGQIATIPLPSIASSPAGGRLLTVTGWGATVEGGASTLLLRKVVVPTVSLQQCNSSSYYNGAVLPGMLCAGIGGKDSCQGDSGGPLVDLQRQPPQQVGIVSWGYGCARPNKPGVYTDVTAYLDWIAEKMSQ